MQLFLLAFSLANAWQSAASQAVIATRGAGSDIPQSLVINPVTNMTYVLILADGYGGEHNSVEVIDGNNNIVAGIQAGFNDGDYGGPVGIAVNPATNKIYIVNFCGNDPYCNDPGTVTVIDGSTNNTTTVTVGYLPYGVAVNSVTEQSLRFKCLRQPPLLPRS